MSSPKVHYDWPRIIAPGGWGNIMSSESEEPSSEHLALSGYSSDRALFPTKADRKEHYKLKGELEELKEQLRRAQWMSKYSHRGEKNWVRREEKRKTRKHAERKARKEEQEYIRSYVPPMYAGRMSVPGSSSSSKKSSSSKRKSYKAAAGGGGTRKAGRGGRR